MVIKLTLLFIAILILVTLLTLLIATMSCKTEDKFHKAHDIELVETESGSFAVCMKCGGQWGLSDVDVALFIRRHNRRLRSYNDTFI